jgi:hypothetical protein
MTPDRFNQPGVFIMKIGIRTAAVAVLLLGMLPATAVLAGHGAEGGMYMSADFGSSTLNARASDYDAFAMQAAGPDSQASVLDSRLDRSDTGWSLVLWGVQEGHLGMEVGHQNLGTMSWEGTLGVDDGEGQIELPAEVGIKSRGWTASALGIWAFNDRVQLEGRVGAYFRSEPGLHLVQ